MANNTVTLTFKVNSDGKLEQVTKQADKAAAATNRAGAAADKYSKKQKGVAQAGMNSTKAFSKMSGQMEGGGGLVAAYAGLAANIFALTAGFGALSRASQATQLEAGLVEMGKASGLAMHTLSRGLVEATGHAISLEESMRSVALITSAGIDASRIEEFGEVARKASVALGRDLQDSMNRLTRGVTKLEPELLDELGIMVRLDEATEKYAQSIGKSASDLSNFEKRQAFLNATLEEGEKKFGALGNVDVNPFDKLSASLQNLAKTGIGGIADLLAPVVKLLAEKPIALTSVLVLFASTISSQVLGSLSSMVTKTREASKATSDLNRKKLQDVSIMNRSSAALTNVIKSMKDGKGNAQAYDKAIKGQAQSQATNLGLLRRRQNQEAQLAVTGKNLSSTTRQLGISQKEYNQRVKTSNKIVARLNISQSQGRQSAAQFAAAKAQAALAEGRFGVAMKNVNRSIKLQTAALKIASRSVFTFSGAMNFASIAAKGLGMALKTLGAGLMRALGAIGMAIMAIQMLVDAYKFLANALKSEEQKKYEEKTKALSEAQKELAGNLGEVDDAFAGQSLKIRSLVGSYTAMNNVLGTFITKYQDLDKAGIANNGSYEEQINALDNLLKSSDTLTAAFEKQFGVTTATALATDSSKQAMTIAKEETFNFIKAQNAQAASARAVGESIKTSKEVLADYLNTMKVSTTVDEMTASVSDLFKTLSTAKDINLGKILQQELNSDQIVLFNLQSESNALKQLGKSKMAIDNKIAANQKKINDSLAGVKSIKTGAASTSSVEINERKKLIALNKELAAKKEPFIEDEKRLGLIMRDQFGEVQKTYQTEQKRQVLAKLQLETAKLGLNIEKAKKSNTITSLNQQITLEDTMRQIQSDNLEAQIKFNQDQIAGLAVKKDSEKLSKEEEKTYNKINALITKLTNEQTLLNIKTTQKTKTLEDTVRLEKMKLTIVKENQTAEKAVLDTLKRKLSAQKESFTLTEKIQKLQVRAANRAAGRDSKLTPAQLAASKLDEDSRKKRVTTIIREFEVKKASIAIEETLLKARMSVLKAEIDVINKKRENAGEEQIPTGDLDAAIASLNSGSNSFSIQLQNAALAMKEQLLVLEEERQTLSVSKLQAQQIAEIEQKRATHLKSVLSAQGSIFGEISKQADLEGEIATLRNTNASGNPRSLETAAKNEEESRQRREQIANMEYNLKVATIKAEEALMDAKFNLLKAEMAASGGGIDAQEAAALNAAQQSLNLSKEANSMKIKTAKMEKTLALETIQAEKDNSIEKAGKAGGFAGALAAIKGASKAEGQDIGSISTQVSEGEKFVADVISSQGSTTNELLREIATKLGVEVPDAATSSETSDTVKKITQAGVVQAGGTTGDPAATDAVAQANAVAGQVTGQVNATLGGSSEGTQEGTITSEGEEGKEGIGGATSNLAALRGMIAGTATDMALLGPEGEGVSQVLNGALAFSEAITDSASTAEMLGGMVAGASAMMAGASKAKIANIDSEIAAEKKRDGKSAESVAKLKALEKKKEQEEKKAFKRKKLMKMASVIISTADGIMNYMSDKNIPMAVATGILGAAQLSIIASTKYNGGGSGAPSASMPTEAQSGKRESKIDLAKGNNAAGEMHYARGGMGKGTGAGDFTSAFTGYKNRAEGGPTGFVVGEQGPELFMPQTPGDIIPAGETEDITQTTPTNVSFNISAVDAKGVEEMLMDQRGSIIGMIREAANENGQLFLEDVEDMTY